MSIPQQPMPESPRALTAERQVAQISDQTSDQTSAPIWAQRISLFILVLFCVYLGAFMVYLPWWPAAWGKNPFFLAHPRLHAFIDLGPVRGIVSGLGLLDIWIGISEAIHYRETPVA